MPEFFIPTATWLVRIRLPAQADRRPDGAIPCHVLAAPDCHAMHRGTTAWLRYIPVMKCVDMTSSPTTVRAHRKGYVHGQGTLGWPAVSLMEAMADQFEHLPGCLSLESPRVLREQDSWVLEITDLPIARAGQWMTLAKFERAGPDGRCIVRHYNHQASDFTGPTRTCHYALAAEPDWPFQMCSLEGVTSLEISQQGFYLFGDFEGEGEGEGKFQIAAIEPRQLSLSQCAGTPAVEELNVNSLRAITSLRQPQSPWSGLVAQTAVSSHEQKTRRWLVIHHNLSNAPRYGYFSRYYRWWIRKLISPLFLANEFIKSGHLALGIARLRPDPLSGAHRLEVTYWQPHLYSVVPLPSGCYDWAAYNGSTSLGCGLLGRVQDLLIPLGADFDKDTPGERYIDSAFSYLRDKIYDLLTGYGTGVIEPGLMNNCSTSTLFALAMAYRASRPALAGDAARLADAIEGAWMPGGLPALWERPHHLQRSPPGFESARLSRRHLRSPYPNVLLESLALQLIRDRIAAGLAVTDWGGELSPGLRPVAPAFHAH